MFFEDLTSTTREIMLEEFRKEQTSAERAPYRPKVLTPLGESVFCSLMEEHLAHGTEATLALALSPSMYWVERGIRNTKRGPVSYVMPGYQRAKVFAISDFNAWYVRAVCKVLMSEGYEYCEVYRAEQAYEPRGECALLEGKRLTVREVFAGHRARYYPEGNCNPEALSIPIGPNCHHSIRKPRAA